MAASSDPRRKELILASTSPYRRILMQRLRLPFRAVPPLVDEEALKEKQPTPPRPRALAESLARAKALSLSERFPQAVIIGSDQVVALDGQVLGKPGDARRAIDQLTTMAGREHELITALAVAHPGGVIERTDVATLRMHPLDRPAIQRYVAGEQPLDCAGSYKLESRGIVLFERIDSSDHTAIIGLPLMALATILRELGFLIP